MPAPDRAIDRLARRHGGHVSRHQLLVLGLSKREIDHRIAVGRLIAVFQGVYAVGHLATNPADRAAGALLACGATAAISHRSAAAHWGIEKQWSLPFEVTVLGADRRPAGITVHRSTVLRRDDLRVHRGLRVTSPALTVLQIAPTLEPKRLMRTVNDLRFEKMLTHQQLADVVDRFPRHPGARHLRPILAVTQEPTRSQLEDDFQRLIASRGLPHHLINHHVGGYCVDVYFPVEHYIVELDGWQMHKTKDAFEHDRRQDLDIAVVTGAPTTRLTYDQVTKRPAACAAKLNAILSDRRRLLGV